MSDAFSGLGEAHMVLLPGHARLIHIPWTDNDYQVDISNGTSWPEYERILEMLGRIGVDCILFRSAGQRRVFVFLLHR